MDYILWNSLLVILAFLFSNAKIQLNAKINTKSKSNIWSCMRSRTHFIFCCMRSVVCIMAADKTHVVIHKVDKYKNKFLHCWATLVWENCWFRGSWRVTTWWGRARLQTRMVVLWPEEINLVVEVGPRSQYNFPFPLYPFPHGGHLTPHPSLLELETANFPMVSHLGWTSLVPYVHRAREKGEKMII